jgi:hypothetical protein
MVSLVLKKTVSDAEVRRVFKLPAAENRPQENVMNISIQQCGKDATCLLLQGFDHMGAGDADCGAE